MQGHRTPLAGLAGNTLRPQTTDRTRMDIEDEAPESLPFALPIRAALQYASDLSNLSRWASTGTHLQVDLEIILGEESLIGTPRHLGHQSALGINEGLPGSTIAVGSIPDCYLYLRASILLALLHQLHCTSVVMRVPGQYLDRSDELRVGVYHHRHLVTVKTVAAALATVAHLRVVNRDDAIAAHLLLQG